MFQPLSNNRPFIKMGLQGFAGGGKSLTASLIAIGLHKLIKSQKPIAVVDTEAGIKSLTDMFNAECIAVQIDEDERSLSAVNKIITDCEQGFADILIIESITTIWETFKQSYLDAKRITFIELQDWGPLKKPWRDQFSEKLIHANCHIIFTGRAGYEYDDEINERTGKRRSFKSGTKMKAEAETAYEPDFLIEMELCNDENKKYWNEATIIKDRTRLIHGNTFKYYKGDEKKVFNDFYPAIAKYLDGSLKALHGPVIPDTFKEFESKFSELAKERDYICAEIEGCFQLMGFGTGADDKQKKQWIMTQIYGVNSFEGLQRKDIKTLRQGLEIVKNFADEYKEYLNTCLDTDTPIDKNRISQMMKLLLNPTK